MPLPPWLVNVLWLLLALFLVALNGFFVAAEFALVKVRLSRIDEMVRQKKPFARTARWLARRLEGSLSACQLGITVASLALGMVAEPAIARLLVMGLHQLHIELPHAALHALAYFVALTTITALHLVIGEQAPKIFAIRRPEQMVLWCAALLKFFYVVSFPLMWVLNHSTQLVLLLVGMKSAGHDEAAHTEEEIRTLLLEAHLRGSLTRSEHRLINAVFEFDDLVVRQIMVPRGDVDFFDIEDSVPECIDKARRTKHTRYPVCDGSLDEILGVVHMKDLVGIDVDESFEWQTIMRPPRKLPENMPISKVLRHFQATQQLMAFVVDEHGTVIGMVTLENVLEKIIGEVKDEFDVEPPHIVPEGPDQWLVDGSTPLDQIQRKFEIEVVEIDADTFSGLLTIQAERILCAGDTIPVNGYLAEVLEVRDDRAVKVRVRRRVDDSEGNENAQVQQGMDVGDQTAKQ